MFRPAIPLSHLNAAFAALLIAGSNPSTAAAQQAPVPEPGDRIRVTATGLETAATGRFVEIQEDALIFEPASGIRGTPRQQIVPLTQLRRLEVSQGMTGSRTVVGIAAGALVGGVVGALAGSLIETETAPIFPPALVLGLAGTGIGALAGGLVGHRIPAEAWHAVPLDDIR